MGRHLGDGGKGEKRRVGSWPVFLEGALGKLGSKERADTKMVTAHQVCAPPKLVTYPKNKILSKKKIFQPTY